MDATYVLLLVLAAFSLILQIEWLLLASIVLFFALIFSKYYSEFSAPKNLPSEVTHESPSTQQPRPIIVVQGGGGGGKTISDDIIAGMMSHYMAMDAYEKKDQAPQFQFLSRGMSMRQNMFDHSGKVGSKHQAMKREFSGEFLEKLNEISKKLDKD